MQLSIADRCREEIAGELEDFLIAGHASESMLYLMR